MRNGDNERDPYLVLEIQPTAPPELIAAAYRTMVKLYHPDIAGDAGREKMVRLNLAFELIGTPAARGRWDAEESMRVRQAQGVRTGTGSGRDGSGDTDASSRLMRFGKWKGCAMSEVPTDYLLWVVDTVEREGDIFDATRELERRGWR